MLRTDSTPPDLPSLDGGVTLLDRSSRRPGALGTLVVDHLLTTGAEALWIDSRDNARTETIARIAPSDRVLDRIHVARAFTAYQHYSLVESLEHRLAESDADRTLLVLPDFDWWYAEDDLRDETAERMLIAAMDRVSALTAEHDVPALVTSASNRLGDRVAARCETRVRCERTRFGPRFVSPSFETLVYHGDGYVQTTLAFWREVLLERHPAAATSTTATTRSSRTVPTEVRSHGTN